MTDNGEQIDLGHHHAHVVVHPLVQDDPPFRGVDILGFPVGQAHSFADVAEICRRAGLMDLDLKADGSVEWLGGDANHWG
ncbi:hypothetical protein [Streptacidiphilus sp. PAMC 29251]